MTVRIRLSRYGSKGNPHYRVIVADSKSARNGRFIEIVGNHKPKLGSASTGTIVFDQPRIEYWLSQGAQPSDVVIRLMQKNNIALTSKIAKKLEVKIKNRKPQVGTSEAPAIETA